MNAIELLKQIYLRPNEAFRPEVMEASLGASLAIWLVISIVDAPVALLQFFIPGMNLPLFLRIHPGFWPLIGALVGLADPLLEAWILQKILEHRNFSFSFRSLFSMLLWVSVALTPLSLVMHFFPRGAGVSGIAWTVLEIFAIQSFTGSSINEAFLMCLFAKGLSIVPWMAIPLLAPLLMPLFR